MVTANSGAAEDKAKAVLHDPYLWHKLHSLSGIFPIGLFLVQHLIANSYALQGARAYNTVIAVYGYLPFVTFLEIGIIYIPILYHAIYGIFISAYGSPNVGKYAYVRNWMYTLQRITGVIAFFYIGFHVWNTSIQKYLQEAHGSANPEHVIQYAAMSHQMANPVMFTIYIVGIVSTIFHFSNGIWNFCIRWGVTISPKSQQITAVVCAGIFVILTAISVVTAISLHAAGDTAQAVGSVSCLPLHSAGIERIS